MNVTTFNLFSVSFLLAEEISRLKATKTCTTGYTVDKTIPHAVWIIVSLF